MMNLLEREQEKLAVLQAADLLALSGSLAIAAQPATGPRSPHRVVVTMNYALAELRVLVTLSKPLDFLVLTPDLLPPEATDTVELGSQTNLLELLRALLRALWCHQTATYIENSAFSHIPENLKDLEGFCPGVQYEMVVRGDKVTLLVRMTPQQDIALVSVKQLLRSDRLVAPDHSYVLRLGFHLGQGKFVAEDWAVQWGADLAAMLPELASTRLPGLRSDETLPQFLMATREQVENSLTRALAAWEERAALLLPILESFDGVHDGIKVNLDSDTMTSLELVLRTNIKTHTFTVSLGHSDKKDTCHVDFSSKRDETSLGRMTRGGLKPYVEYCDFNDALELTGLKNSLIEWVNDSIAEDAKEK